MGRRQDRRAARRGAGIAPRRRRRRWVWWTLGVVVVLAGFLAVCGLLAYHSVQQARASLQRVQSLASRVADDPTQLETAAGRANAAQELDAITRGTAAAQRTLDGSFGLRVLGFLPYLSTQRSALSALVSDLRTAAGTSRGLLSELDTLAASTRGTTFDLPALQAFEGSVAQAAARLRSLDRPAAGLLAPLASARRKFDREDAKVAADLARGRRALAYASLFLGAGGPRVYFLAAENNAEMRDQGGVESYALVSARDGNLSVASPQSVGALRLAAPAPVAIPPGTEQVFGMFQPTQLWTSTNATADFPFSGAAMQAMYASATGGQHVDGVVGLDVVCLAGLLRLTGPVVVPGINQPITAANVTGVLLHQLYVQNPVGSQAARNDQLAAVVKAAFDRMQAEHVDLAALANTLAKSIAGRHLMVWDQTPAQEQVLSDLGASGAIDTSDPTRTFHLAVESAVAAKLDYYVHVSVAMKVTVTQLGDALVDTSVTVANGAPAGQPPSYQLGPDNINSTTPGQYVTRVYLWSPRGSSTAGGVAESGLVVNEASASVLPQRSGVLTFQSVIPHAVRHGQLDLRLVPQPLLRPVTAVVTLNARGWRVGSPGAVTATLDRPRDLRWALAR